MSLLENYKALLEMVDREDAAGIAHRMKEDRFYCIVFGMRRTWLFIDSPLAQGIIDNLDMIPANSGLLVLVTNKLHQYAAGNRVTYELVDHQPEREYQISKEHLVNQLSEIGMERMMDKIIL